MKFLLSNITTGLVEYFKMPSMWVALLLFIMGTSLVILARRITRVIRKEDIISDKDRYLILFKCLGVVAMFVGILIVVLITR